MSNSRRYDPSRNDSRRRHNVVRRTYMYGPARGRANALPVDRLEKIPVKAMVGVDKPSSISAISGKDSNSVIVGKGRSVAVAYYDDSQSVAVSVMSGRCTSGNRFTDEPKKSILKSRSARKARKKIRGHNVVNYEKKQPIMQHVEELRKRAIVCILVLIAGGALGYYYQAQVIEWLVRPLSQQLFYTSPTGGFDFLIKICLFFGFLLSIPVIVYNIIKFLAPALPKRVTYSTSNMLLTSILLAITGAAFAYYISLPAALHFLGSFTNGQIQSLISAQEYFSFVMIYLAGFAALFQMPLIISFINKINPLKPAAMMQKQRYVILGSFIVAAMLTPTPDPMNQTIMAVPMVGLYQTSVGVVWQQNRRKTRRANKALHAQERDMISATVGA